MKKIESVAIVGGTHGNEFSGIYLLRKWEQYPEQIIRDSFSTQTLFANPKAFEENKRYLDCDLNRQFLVSDLENPALTNYEQSRAKVMNLQLGPKGNAKTDLIIDLHNTTSNMGPTLILLQSDDYNKQMGAYLRQQMPSSVIVFEDQSTVDEHYFVSSIAEQGVIVEIGPQPQSVLRQDVLDEMEEMTQHILDYIEHVNAGTLPKLDDYDAYRYKETLTLPMDHNGERIGMVHKNVQDNDFKPLRNGDPIFTLFSGEEICWKGDYEAYPHFINEAAYYDNNLAMSLGEKFTVQL
ncbi:aspartoacylase [Thaumasiovibrio subtropicus]|uniref:aspartoacylase n=1 Tax=Thaumasiovibrio subtropicus TaxID=1891207 RepID=UPI000B35CFC0|nr:aspartoacylase [Thaumasiovibrio subtropicus]